MKSSQREPSGVSRRQFVSVAAGVVAGYCLVPAESSVAAQPAKAAKKAAAEPPPVPPKKKYPLKLGLASYSLRKFDLDKTIAMTKRVGLEWLCLKSMHLPLEAKPADIAAAAKKVRDAGLNLYGCGVVSMKKDVEVTQAFDYAKAAGMKMIVAAPAPELLPLLDKMVKQYDIAVAIHNHGPGDKIWPTPESIYTKIRTLDKRIGLCIDIGHTVRIGADLLDSTRKYADRILDVHIKDITEASPRGRGIEAGRGVLDLRAFVRLLCELKYQGVVSFEYEEQPDDPLPGLAESVGYVKGLMPTL